MTTRARRRKLGRQALRATQSGPLDIRARHGWLVRLAAWTRSARMLRLAARFVRIESRLTGMKDWVRLDVRPEIGPDGHVRLVPRGGA